MLWLGLILLCGFFACESKKPSTPPDQTYTVRGVVESLPIPPKQFLKVHHEAVPDFKNAEGRVTGMGSMVMDFPNLAPGLSLDGIQVGDKVEFTMEMRWKSEPRYQVGSIRKLPPDTELSFEKKPG